MCRINPQTLESEVLFEADSPQGGIFCVSGGYVYFLEQKNVSYPEGEGDRANLWRVKCDGSEPELLAKEFQVGAYSSYRMEIYDDILYLISNYGGLEEYQFFQLSESGKATEVSAEKTLYGMLPAGYSDAHENYRYTELPDLVYCMRHYGYVFVIDAENHLFRLKLKSEEPEQVPLPFHEAIALTNDSLLYMQNKIWYSMSLDDLSKVTELGELECYNISFWDDRGLYYANRGYGEDSFRLTRLGWDGENETLHYQVKSNRLGSSLYGDYVNLIYSDGTYLYYDGAVQGNGVIWRIALEEDDAEAEQVFVYYENIVKEISTRETYHTTFTEEITGEKGDFSLTKVYLTEESEAAKKINAFLEEYYSSEEEYIGGLMDTVRNAGDLDYGSWTWNNTLITTSLSAHVDYLDEDYIGICMSWYECWSGAAHGMHGRYEYVFSRATGEQLQVTDVLGNTKAEICAIIGPYVKSRADWGTSEEGWEEIILEDGRFYLTTEGIGIHFDVYELSCYAAGDLDVVVPYEEFELRDLEKPAPTDLVECKKVHQTDVFSKKVHCAFALF